jgi:hypothetical protein
MKKNADRFVHAIFCDDMRHEMGNKVSFMGCYQGELFVPFAPIALPKLCVYVTISTPAERPFTSLSIRVDQGNNTIANVDTTSADWAQPMPPAPDDVTMLLANVGVMLSPFAITEPGDIRVVVTTEEGAILGPRLHLKVLPPTDAVAKPNETVAPMKATRKVTTKRASARDASAKKTT